MYFRRLSWLHSQVDFLVFGKENEAEWEGNDHAFYKGSRVDGMWGRNIIKAEVEAEDRIEQCSLSGLFPILG